MEIVGVDIGGTFTDLVTFDADRNEVQVGKTSSTPGDPAEGVITGVEELGIDLETVGAFLHGTTVTTNAVIEGTGAECGLITTEGFGDVLEIGWRERPHLWGLEGEYEPVIPRVNCREVPERTDASGAVRTAVSADDVREAGEQLLDGGAESVAICFLHSYANPENERRAADHLREIWPNDHVVRSSAILPEYREFERASTTAITAYTQPIIGTYLERLQEQLNERGLSEEISVMQSNGGIASTEVSKERSANTVLSGPAAGASAAAHVGRIVGDENVISCDMGGTSFDVTLLPDGEPIMTQETTLGYQKPVRVPMIDINTIGTGGGSIAKIDKSGILGVGPESAGADPGPVCYGQGGTDVTITDANLALRRINPDDPIGGDDRLDVARTEDVLSRTIADRLDFTVEEAASAIIDVGVDKMARKIRALLVDEGHDPREFTMVIFGGAGPLHAGELIRESNLSRAVVPFYPGILSALGCVLSDVQYDQVRSVNETIERLDPEGFHATVETLEERCSEMLSTSSASLDGVDLGHEAKMRYAGQTHSIGVPLHDPRPSKADLRRWFDERYGERYAETTDNPVLVDNVKVTVVGETRKPDLKRFIRDGEATLADALVERRDVYFDDEWYDCPVYDRERVPLGTELAGPAILEQKDTTTVVNPGIECSIDEYGNAILEER